MKRKLLTAILCLFPFLSGCGGGGDGITLKFKENKIDVEMDQIVDLHTLVEFSKDLSLLTFSSNNNFAKIDNLHYVKGMDIGESTISVTYESHSATMKVNVINYSVAITSIALSDDSCDLEVDKTKALSWLVQPKDARGQRLKWTSSNENVATINDAGVITAKGEGNATIKVEAYSSDVSAQCEVRVSPLFPFPELSSFATPEAYKSPVTSKWQYQAKVDGNKIYLYLKQTPTLINASSTPKVDYSETHTLVRIFDSSFGGGSGGTDLYLFANGAHKLNNETGVQNVDLKVNKTSSMVEYKCILTLDNETSDNTSMKFFEYDPSDGGGAYNNSDLVKTMSSRLYHTSPGQNLAVKDKICFKDPTNYLTPQEYQTKCTDHYEYHMLAADEGLYMYVKQHVSEIYDRDLDADGKWHNATHIEFKIWHYNFHSQNPDAPGDTYTAIWQDGSYYNNNWSNVKGVDSFAKITKQNDDTFVVEYFYFARFDNNLANPLDGPYAFVEVKVFDMEDNNEPYSSSDYVAYQDDRFVHVNRGDSCWVHANGIDKIDDNYTGSWADIRKQRFIDKHLSKENLTLFIGDSYFESDNWWVNFYQDFNGKNAFTTAIGGTTVLQWLNFREALVDPYKDGNNNIKNIVIHLGYNDIVKSQIPNEQLEKFTQKLLVSLHDSYPNCNIYFLSIGRSAYFSEFSSLGDRADAVDALTKSFCEGQTWAT